MLKKIFLISFSLLLLSIAPLAVFAQGYFIVGQCSWSNQYCCGYWDGSKWICTEEWGGYGCGNCGKWRIDLVWSYSCGCWKWGSWYCYGQGVCSSGSESCSSNSYSLCTTSCTWQNNGLTAGKCGVAANYGSGCGNCGTVNWEGTCINQGACTSGQTQSQGCGLGGTQTRTCSSSCSWSAWSTCAGEGSCSPGQTQSQGCGFGGTQTRACQSNYQWGDWGVCTGGGVCGPGQTESQACGNCGAQTRTCQSNYQWGQWGTCTGQGECPAGQTQSQGCGFGGTQTRACSSSCTWGSYGSCVGSGECNAGTKEQKRCGYCGTTTKTCQSNYLWGLWSNCAETNSCAYASECDTGTDKYDACGNSCKRDAPASCISSQIQIRTAPNNNGQIGQWTQWTGPDGTSATFYKTSGQQINSMHNKNKIIQYKAIISSGDSSKTVSLDDVKITFSGKFNQKPIVNAKDQEVTLGTPVKFNATAIDIGGRIISYSWDFGDNSAATGSSAVHNYAKPGAYDAKVTVMDNDGANATANVKVFVNTYNCLSEAEPRSGPASNLFTPSDSVVQQKATEALLEYAQSKGIKVQDIDTTLEYYEAANDYITRHTSYTAVGEGTIAGQGWDGASAKKLFTESAGRGCGNDFCGDCEDFAITTEALLRAMGVSPKCAYVACSRIHCWNIINVGGRFRLLEPQKNSIESEFNSAAYDWTTIQGGVKYVVYAADNVFNDVVGRYFIVNDANPTTYTLNYQGTNGLPDPSNKCPNITSPWSGVGDQTYFEDKCP